MDGQPAVKAIHANRLMLWANRHYQYDEFGNLIRERRGKRQHTEHCFTWDGQHRLIEFKKIRHYHDAHDPQFHETVVSRYRYTYDAFGRRISKTDMQTGDKTLFFWLGDKLLTECHADDANFHPSVVNNERDKANNYRCRSYVYTPDGHGFSPLAQINGRGRGGEIYYYCNDQLGTPQELVTAQGEIVWSAVYKSYGNLAIDYQTVPQPLRLPGQYFDEESGLHYNRYRYYDPHCARYISQDPIGLAGGENAYSYVANPITWIDPLGLNEVCPGTEAGKGTGGVSTQTGTVVYSPNVSQQKQMRHIQGTAPANKSYLNSLDDAQKVLDAYNSGNYRLISENAKQSTVVIEVKEITGRYINTGNPNGLPDVNKPTNIFMIQSSRSPKIVPVNPNKGGQ